LITLEAADSEITLANVSSPTGRLPAAWNCCTTKSPAPGGTIW
jgi:hypothetical protein